MQRGRRIAGAPPKKRARVLVAGLTALLISPMTLVLAAPVSLADDSMTTETASPAATPSPNDKGAGSDKATDSPKATDPSPANTAVDKPKQDSTDDQKASAEVKTVKKASVAVTTVSQFDNWVSWETALKPGVTKPKDGGDVTFPQPLIKVGTSKTFVAEKCGVWVQNDHYVGPKADVEKLWADGKLTQAENGAIEDSNYVKDFSFTYSGDCVTKVTVAEPKFTPGTCTAVGSVEATDTADYTWSHTNDGDKVTYTAKATSKNIELTGQTSWTYDLSKLTGGQCETPKKVFVCKYVGTPGVDERLQTGQNPISVSVNSIKDYNGPGSYFADAQGRSYVLEEDNGQPEPDVSKCPAPPPIQVVPDKPTKVDLCEPADGPSPDGVNIPEADMGHYTIDGKPVAAGFNAVAGTSAKVAFVPDAGGVVPEGSESEWTYTFTKDKCYVPPTNQCTAGKGDLSTNVNPTWVNVDTRANGHYSYVAGGLHVQTTTTGAKVSLGHAANFDLKNTGVLDLEWTGSTPPPGINLFVNFDGTHTGTLVYESVYGQDLWLTNGSSQYVKDNAPVNGGGNGSQWHGTINQWLEKFPDAKVTGIAFSLGSGVLGDGVIKSITVNCGTYTFDVVKPTVSLVATDQQCVPSNEQGHEGTPVYTGGTLVVTPDTAKVYKSDDIGGTALDSLADVAPGSYTAVLTWKNGTETMAVQSDAATVNAAKDCTVLPPAPKVVPKQESTEDCYGHHVKTWDEVYNPAWKDGAWTFDGVEPTIENVKESTTPLTNDEWWTLGCYPEQPPALSEHQSDKKANCDGNYEMSWDLVSTFAWVWFEGEQWSLQQRGEWVAQQPVVENFKDWHWVSALNSDQKKELKCTSGPHNGISPDVPWVTVGTLGALAAVAVGGVWFASRRRHNGLQG